MVIACITSTLLTGTVAAERGRNVLLRQKPNFGSVKAKAIALEVDASLMAAEHVESEQNVIRKVFNHGEAAIQVLPTHFQRRKVNPPENIRGPDSARNAAKPPIEQVVDVTTRRALLRNNRALRAAIHERHDRVAIYARLDKQHHHNSKRFRMKLQRGFHITRHVFEPNAFRHHLLRALAHRVRVQLLLLHHHRLKSLHNQPHRRLIIPAIDRTRDFRRKRAQLLHPLRVAPHLSDHLRRRAVARSATSFATVGIGAVGGVDTAHEDHV
mmetsp:Transcript_8544/g.18277  ORF Transcript_8544/g.18277 Transcript_8544/m.18277 type:complete len:269 (-) Transcript_8544:313-1119(-)